MGFIFLSIIPLICSALDVIYLILGAIGMGGILALMVILNNGRKLWDFRHSFNRVANIKTFFVLSFKLSSDEKKKIKKVIIISIIATLFMYKTCLCFYNAEIGYYN